MSVELNRRTMFQGAALAGVAGVASLGASPAVAADYNLSAPATPTLKQTGDLLFASQFNTSGFRQYKNFHPTTMKVGRDVGIQKDPSGGGKVAWLDSRAGLSHGNAHGRASLEAPVRFYASAHGNTKAVYGHKVRIHIPREFAFSNTGQWLGFMGVHGAPWNTGSATGLMMVYNPRTRNHYLRMGNDPAVLREADTVVQLGVWVDVLQYFNYNYKSRGGWARLFMATRGGPWKEVPIRGVKGGYRMDTITAGEGSGWYHNKSTPAATARCGVYGNRPMKILLAHQEVARTLGPLLDGRKIDGRPLSALGGLR